MVLIGGSVADVQHAVRRGATDLLSNANVWVKPGGPENVYTTQPFEYKRELSNIGRVTERCCQYVGGSIGTVLASMFGTTSREAQHKMAMLGRAFQRTNIPHCRTKMARTTPNYQTPIPYFTRHLTSHQENAHLLALGYPERAAQMVAEAERGQITA
jgi:hypothetical protein